MITDALQWSVAPGGAYFSNSQTELSPTYAVTNNGRNSSSVTALLFISVSVVISFYSGYVQNRSLAFAADFSPMTASER